MEQANVVPRMNPLILSTDRQYLDFTATPGELCYSSCIIDSLAPYTYNIYLFTFIYFLLFLSCFAVVDDWEDTTMFSYLDSRDKTAVVAKRMKYFTNSGKKSSIILCLIKTVSAISDEYAPFHFQQHSDLQQYQSLIQASEIVSGSKTEQPFCIYLLKIY